MPSITSNWGCEGGQCGRGFGHQEQFRGCADVSITASGSQSYNNLAYPNNNQNQGMQNAYRPVSYIPDGNGNSNTQNYGNQISNQNSILHILSGQTSGYGNNVPMCKATDQYRAQFPYADQFCIDQCKAGRCLSEYFCTSGCKNLNTQISICEATPSFKARYPYATQYCNTICKSVT
ncbi:hypothetical protein KUTeg_009416 [Tegillarca granosa]|uniref:Uncharacterized protein n=1 Tax=Tegillarca granosa TaxID=220873 RepID=A0ABQ9F8T7_TEGGR|nr:hypothetical protein KUTeg_009416 [Tegillarca granosa]